MSDSSTDRFRVIKMIAWIYVALGSALMCCALMQVDLRGYRMQPADAILPSLMIIGAIGTLIRKQWGRYISYFFSVILLLGIPVGTFLGFFMISRLTHERDLFK
jgi:hypothetical protein